MFRHKLISILCFILCVMFCFRSNELRHRLIPLYSYDPAEEQDNWWDAGKENEEEELAVRKPLKLYFTYIMIYLYFLLYTWVKILSHPQIVFSLQEPLHKKGKLSFFNSYGIWTKKKRRMCPVEWRSLLLYFVLDTMLAMLYNNNNKKNIKCKTNIWVTFNSYQLLIK